MKRSVVHLVEVSGCRAACGYLVPAGDYERSTASNRFVTRVKCRVTVRFALNRPRRGVK